MVYFGIFDYSSSSASSVLTTNVSYDPGDDIPYHFWPLHSSWNYTGGYVSNTPQNPLNANYWITECELFENAVSFGNVDVYSDTCNFIANWFNGNAMICFSQDFPFNFRNNRFDNKPVIYLAAATAKGTNEIVNNFLEKTYLHLAYCPQGNLFNFSDVTIHILNNENYSNTSIYAPDYSPNTSSYAALPVYGKGIVAYNSNNDIS